MLSNAGKIIDFIFLEDWIFWVFSEIRSKERGTL